MPRAVLIGGCVVLFFEPGERYVAISITGYVCELQCEYCRGRWLRGMIPAPTPSRLEQILEKLAKRRVNGVLISGGFNRAGYLPVEPFIPVLKRFRKRHRDIIISMHSGLMPLELLEQLKDVVDILDFEIPATRVQRVWMHLPASLNEYLYTARAAKAMGFQVAPHLLLGLPGSSLSEEVEAARYIAYTLRPEVLVLLYYIESPVSPRCIIERLRSVALAARRYAREVSLGCMRPRSAKRLDIVLHGFVDRVAVPLPTYRRDLAKPLPYCCSLPSLLLLRDNLLE